MGRYLLLGGAGFIGLRLARRLTAHGHQVIIVDNLSRQVHSRPTAARTMAAAVATFVEADAATYEWLDEAVLQASPFDAIVHLAAETGTGQSMYEAQQYVRANVESLALLNDVLVGSGSSLMQTRACGKRLPAPALNRREHLLQTKRVVLASSRAVYGDARTGQNGHPLNSDEDDRLAPRSIYAATKLAQEHLLFAGFAGIETCALRFQNVYGEGQSMTNPYTGVVSVFASAALDGRPIRVFDDGLMSRDFVHVDDAVSALLLAVSTPHIPYSVFNVGTGSRTSILKVAETINRLAGGRSRIDVTGEHLAGDIRHAFANISRLRGLGWEPTVSLDDGLGRFMRWAADVERDSGDTYGQSIDNLTRLGLLSSALGSAAERASGSGPGA